MNEIEEDDDIEYINYLKSFKIPRVIQESEQDTLEFEEAINLNDICIEQMYLNEQFYLEGKLTNKGYMKLPENLFDKIFK